MTTRAWLRISVCAWIAIGLSGMMTIALAQSATAPTASETVGKLAMEHINRLQESVKKQTRRYASWNDVVQLPDFVSGAPEGLRGQITADPEQAIAGYITHVESVNGGDGYIALLVNRETGYAVRSDDSGVISIGVSLDPDTKKPSRSFVHFARAR